MNELYSTLRKEDNFLNHLFDENKDDYLNIKWPKKNPIISKKDSSNALDFKEYYKSYFNKR